MLTDQVKENLYIYIISTLSCKYNNTDEKQTFIYVVILLSRVKGRNVEENQYIKMGAYHTVDLEPNRKFTLFKEEWDSVTVERVENACDPAKVGEF